MTEPEGVIQYHLDFEPGLGDDFPAFAEVNAWRTLLHQLGLIGQDPKRYQGLGFGNMSFRLNDGSQFVITGSQTGELSQLSKAHYSTVLQADPRRNYLKAVGACKPSSEALTHAAVYASDSRVKAVIHVHSPQIWRNFQPLNIPAIDATIGYGTPAMAEAVSNLFELRLLDAKPIFAMLGHEDGIIAFGHSITEASLTLIKRLALALQISA
jgi:hypothetical protein